MTPSLCSIDECNRPHHAKGFCHRHYTADWRDRNPEKAAETAANYRSRPESRARAAEVSAAWREANPERAKAAVKAWRVAHPDREREGKRTYREANRDAIRALNNRRKARQRDVAINDLTPSQWVQIIAAHDGRCAYCGTLPDRITMDHVIPISKGGNHTASNIVPACGPCNSAKGDGPAPPFVINPAA